MVLIPHIHKNIFKQICYCLNKLIIDGQAKKQEILCYVRAQNFNKTRGVGGEINIKIAYSVLVVF